MIFCAYTLPLGIMILKREAVVWLRRPFFTLGLYSHNIMVIASYYPE